MKYLKFSVCIMFSIIFSTCITSCHEEEESWDARRDMAGWGYFVGTINGDSVCLYNNHYMRYVSYTPYPYHTYNYNDIGRIDIEIPEKEVSFSCRILNPSLCSLEIINQHPENPHNFDFNSFKGWSDNGFPYEPKNDCPAKVDITNIEYRSVEEKGVTYTSIHIIEGNVDAVLYKGEDSISIKGHFATK